MSFDSPFLHSYESNGKKVLFHSLTLEFYSSLEDVPSPATEQKLLKHAQLKAGEDSGIVMGCMFLSTRCSRDCGYCFLQGVEPGAMNLEEVDRGLDLLGRGPADLLLYGGEPFLQPELIKHVVRRVRETGVEINLSIATGGVSMDTSLVAELAAEDAFIIVSIDGPPSVHNPARPLRNGADSFAEAEKAFHIFKSAGCRVGISVTVTENSIAEVTDNFLWLMDHFKPDDMGLNPWLHPLKGGVANPLQASNEKILSAVTSCMELAIDRGMYIEQLARRVRPFVGKIPRLKDCASAGGRLVQVPNGTCGTCDCMTVCGDHGVPVGDEKALKDLLTSFRDLSPVNFPDCMGCPVLMICGGGCRYDAYHASGSLRGRWSDRCIFERDFLKWMIDRSVIFGRDSLIPKGGFRTEAMPMPVGTMIGEEKAD